MIRVENGVLAAAAKNPAMPTTANAAGCGANAGHRWFSPSPTAPPAHPPITIDGPNTPPDPPDPIVSPVVRILPTDTARSTPASPAGSVNAVCRMPYPNDRTDSTAGLPPNP